ncbi:MAG: hypothetical protein K940chlam3_01518 [Chlamydiae bacterium]|nr:hypothetical protein [Chlamydiota bacterium]
MNFSVTNSFDMPVVKAPYSSIALQDTICLSPADMTANEGDLCCVINNFGKQMILPVKSNPRVAQGKIALSSAQRRTLYKALGESATVSMINERLDDLPLISNVFVTYTRRFGNPIPDENSAVKSEFYQKFKHHPLNVNHRIPINISGSIYFVAINKLLYVDPKTLDSEEVPCGVMERDCRLFGAIQPRR